mmetsp:Transcript_23056/g.37657  ORF Transcript_23056/g.37657 Transcript_23056/m.37657 type:complete len:114 (+) Transcript_23056:33-374(+)
MFLRSGNQKAPSSETYVLLTLQLRRFEGATTLFELALWKYKIDQSGASVDCEACRVEVPGSVKDTIFQYLEGKRIAGTLCIPPEKCGPLNAYTHQNIMTTISLVSSFRSDRLP